MNFYFIEWMHHEKFCHGSRVWRFEKEMSKFSRWTPPLDNSNMIIQSWAFKRFHRFHSEINHMYWATVASSKAAFSVTKGHTKEESMPVTFGLTTEDAGYRGVSLGEWRMNFLEAQNWIRLNALMALSSYFENYIQSIGNLAFESNPGILFKTHQILDGTIILKAEKHYIFTKETTPLVKGAWPKRISVFKKLYGDCPESLTNNVGELEKIREIRNGIGHAFGRTLNTKDLLNIAEYHSMDRLSEKRLKKWLGLVFTIARDIDQLLLAKHIGAYECIRYYHYWYKKSGRKIVGSKNPNHIRKLNIKSFIRYFHEELMPAWGGPPPDQQYLEELIDYYGG